MTLLSKSDIAWAAGLFEGEGSMSIKRGRHGRPAYAIAMLVSTDEDIVRRFAAIVGFGSIYGPHYRPSRPAHKPTWAWQVQREWQFSKLVELFDPYFGERRRQRAYQLRNDLGRISDEQLHFNATTRSATTWSTVKRSICSAPPRNRVLGEPVTLRHPPSQTTRLLIHWRKAA